LRQGKSIEKRRRNKIKGGRRREEGTFIQRKKNENSALLIDIDINIAASKNMGCLGIGNKGNCDLC